VILLDVDRFKEVNEALGHEMGDYLLKGIAERLLRSLGARATIARMGSDEFVVLLQEDESPESASSVAAWIFEAFRKPFRVAGQEITINLSMGISLCPNDGLTTGSLLRHADIALNRVKSEGGDGFHFFRSEMDSEASERLTMRHELRMAIERREFLAHYQPVIDMQSGRIAAMESLVRWRHPEKGILSPARFIPIAEETGLIVDIGQWIMTTACAQNRFWQGLGHHALRVSVNLSGRQFREKNIIDVVSRALDQTGIEPSCLEVEITESTAMWDLEKTIDILHRMADLGIRIAIDDFGKGYSSFYYLKSFPIHTLKIDRAFIADVTSSPNDAAIVRSIITMAHGLNLRVVAEGVETEEQFYFLKQNGCDAAQGFFFSKPMPGDDFLPFLNNWSDLH
jgi:diguanylate cyclase (GGDEF)-like protein